MINIIKGGASATAGAGWMGPGALAVGAAVIAGLSTYLMSAGGDEGGSPPSMSGGGATPSIEPANVAAESNKASSAPKSMSRYGAEKNIMTYIYVDPVTGKAVQKQAGQEHFADAQRIVTPGG